jgi:hypothetical protein
MLPVGRLALFFVLFFTFPDREGIRFVRTFGILSGVSDDPWSVHEDASYCLRGP